MRSPDALYDGDLNNPDQDQGEAAREVFEFVQALRQAAESDDKLTAAEVFQVAIEHAPGAAARVLTMVRGGDPIQSDIEMMGHILSRQLGAYDAPEDPPE